MGGTDIHGPERDGVAVFVLTAIATLAGAAWIATGVRAGRRPELLAGILVVGATYLSVAIGHHEGPLTAGLEGLALLALAHLSHGELDRTQKLPTLPGAWPWRWTLALTVTCVLLDGLAALVSGGGRPRPGSPSTLSLVVGCAVVLAVVVGLTALADGVTLPTRRPAPDDGDDPSL